jgi:hypothetical protein
MEQYLEYEVRPGSNLPRGLPRQHLTVLSPIWRAPAIILEYPDGEVYTLVGWSGSDPGQGFPFMALAASLIPAEVREVIGPPPAAEPPPLRLLR